MMISISQSDRSLEYYIPPQDYQEDRKYVFAQVFNFRIEVFYYKETHTCSADDPSPYISGALGKHGDGYNDQEYRPAFIKSVDVAVIQDYKYSKSDKDCGPYEPPCFPIGFHFSLLSAFPLSFINLFVLLFHKINKWFEQVNRYGEECR